MKKSVLWMCTGILCNAIGALLLYYMLKINQYPDLQLEFEMIEVKQGENVDAGMYVSSYTSENGRVILPEIHTEKCGNYAVVYSLVQDNERIDRILLVEVKK